LNLHVYPRLHTDELIFCFTSSLQFDPICVKVKVGNLATWQLGYDNNCIVLLSLFSGLMGFFTSKFCSIILILFIIFIAKDCLLTGQGQASSRITRLVGCLSPCQRWSNTQENCHWLPFSDYNYWWYPLLDQARIGIRNTWSNQSFA